MDERATVALMAAACGIADAVGFVQTGVFAANMTGNTVLAGLSLANADWPTALDRVVTLATFFAGAMGGRAMQHAQPSRPWLPLVIEATLIAGSAFVDPMQTAFVWLLAAAMGIQATAITRVHGVAISTVVVTSTIARLAERAVDALAGVAPADATDRAAASGFALTWIAYAVGAIVAVLLTKVTSLPLIVPAAIVLLVSALRRGTATAR